MSQLTNKADEAQGSGQAPEMPTHRELRQLMDLTIAQIEAALREAQSSADALGRELVTVSRQAKGSQAAQAALAHMQFFDKLSQRLSHARAGLEIPIKHLASAPPVNSANWNSIKDELRNLYTTSDERVLFDIHFGGLHAGNFMKALEQMRESSRSGELDLF